VQNSPSEADPEREGGGGAQVKTAPDWSSLCNNKCKANECIFSVNCILSGFCKNPCFTITPRDPLYFNEEETITIQWEYWSNTPLLLAQWGLFDSIGNIKQPIAQRENNKITYLSPFQDRAKIENDYSSLTLQNLKSDDSGHYGCKFTFQGGFVLKNTTRLMINENGRFEAFL